MIQQSNAKSLNLHPVFSYSGSWLAVEEKSTCHHHKYPDHSSFYLTENVISWTLAI
jgi:hypothetical protein